MLKHSFCAALLSQLCGAAAYCFGLRDVPAELPASGDSFAVRERAGLSEDTGAGLSDVVDAGLLPDDEGAGVSVDEGDGARLPADAEPLAEALVCEDALALRAEAAALLDAFASAVIDTPRDEGAGWGFAAGFDSGAGSAAGVAAGFEAVVGSAAVSGAFG